MTAEDDGHRREPWTRRDWLLAGTLLGSVGAGVFWAGVITERVRLLRDDVTTLQSSGSPALQGMRSDLDSIKDQLRSNEARLLAIDNAILQHMERSAKP